MIQLCPECKKELGWKIQRVNGMYQYELKNKVPEHIQKKYPNAFRKEDEE
jgi:putative cell wall-binding protein